MTITFLLPQHESICYHMHPVTVLCNGDEINAIREIEVSSLVQSTEPVHAALFLIPSTSPVFAD